MRQRQPAPRRVVTALAAAALLPALSLAADPARAAVQPVPGAQVVPPRAAADRSAAFMVRLEGAPAATAATTARRRGASRAQAGRQARRQHDDNAAAQDRAMRAADARGLIDRELYRVRAAYNGVAVLAAPSDVDRLRALPDVADVVPLPEHARANAMSVPAIGAPTVWTAPRGLTGQGVRVGVIDTGIDYVHRAFGGSGDAGDLAYARSAASNPVAPSTPDPSFTVTRPGGGRLYPSARVTGGFDFAGDGYDASRTAAAVPRPDPNPLDCPVSAGGGHGTHVAATIGGDGVASTGATLPWRTVWPPASPPIVGTGVAPDASLVALRVFGCEGTTNLVPLAIEWALDPNGDGDDGDRLDVLNLSLGSPFGSDDDPSAVAVQNAVAAGVVVVTSAGNSGDQTYQVGSPGVAPRAVTVANMVTGGWRDAIEVTGASTPGANGLHQATFAADFDWNALAAPVSALAYRPTGNLTGCSAFTGDERTASAGKVVVLDWLSGGTSPCGSAARVANAADAGAVGVVLAGSAAEIDLTIAGTAAIPAAYVAAATRGALLGAIADGGATVRLDPGNAAVDYDTTQAGTVSASSSRGPAGGGGLKPDLAAPGSEIRSAAAGTGRGALTMSGTSMAAPHVAGAMAILRQRHPTWSPEELKAAVVGTADPDLHVAAGQSGARHTPARVGTGTLDVAAAVDTDVVAFADDSPGAVGVSFGALRIPLGAPFAAERTITVANHGASAATYAIAFEDRNVVPGVVLEPDASSITVPAGERGSFGLRLRVDDPSQLRNVRDPALAATQTTASGTFARRWLAEATGLVRLTAAGRPALSVAAHASVRPAAAPQATQSALELPAGATTGAITFTGTAFATGTTTGDFAARRTMLEHQAASPQRPVVPGQPARRRADIRHVGIGASAETITFGVTTWGPSPAPADFTAVEVAIDLDRNGTADRVVYPARLKDSDVFVTCVWNATLGVNAGCYLAPTAPAVAAAEGGTYDSDVLTLTVARSAVGLQGGTRFAYVVRTWTADSATPVDTVGPLTWSPAARGVAFATDEPRPDAPTTETFAYDPAAAQANGTLGALILHHLGAADRTAEAIAVSAPPAPADPPAGDPPTDPPPVPQPPTPPTLLAPVPAPPPPLGPTARRCRVPKLSGRTLGTARKLLRRANCGLGRVTRPKPRTVRGKRVRQRTLVVARQGITPGRVRAPGTKVALRLRERPRR